MSQNNNKLSTEPYKGVRDFYPEDQAIQNYIFKTWKDAVQKFGFVEYNTSILEPAELYRAKSGEEIVNEQTYTFTDRGEREVTLRPEMTPSVARLVAGKKRDLSFPLRWYSVPNLFRYERPQRGRTREHWQLNCDMFGVDSISAEVEMIQIAYAIMKAFGARDGDFKIKISSRKLLDATLDKAGITGDAAYKIKKLLDKKAKIDNFAQLAEEIIGKPYDVTFEPDADVSHLLETLKNLGITNAEFDPEIIRGFDYYTGIVFEVHDTHPENNRSMFGGGRFDDLLSLFSEEKIPAVGFGMGDVTMRDFLELRDLLPRYTSSAKLYLVNAGVPDEKLFEIATELRAKDIAVAMDLSGKKIGDQIKKAVRDAVEFATVIGENELASGEISVKHLASEKEEKVKLSELADYIKNF